MPSAWSAAAAGSHAGATMNPLCAIAMYHQSARKSSASGVSAGAAPSPREAARSTRWAWGLEPFMRRGTDRRREVVFGQWGMIPPRSRVRELRTAEGRRLSIHNVRIEGIAAKWAFRNAWRRGQRCLIPAESLGLPRWETGHEVWWTFRRADGMPWALAGLWSEWKDPVSGEIVPSYTMITESCDEHPLLGHMHKPDPKLPPSGRTSGPWCPSSRRTGICGWAAPSAMPMRWWNCRRRS